MRIPSYALKVCLELFFMHPDHQQVGMPCGTFVLNEDSSRPVVLISGGVGLTPMISMLDHILAKVGASCLVQLDRIKTRFAEIVVKPVIKSTAGIIITSESFLPRHTKVGQ